MFNVKCHISVSERVSTEVDVLDPPVALYAFDENGDCIVSPTPESETMRVPQDGARLELKNLAKYGAAMTPEEYIPVNNLDRMQTATAVQKFCSKMNNTSNKTNKINNTSNHSNDEKQSNPPF